MSRSCAVATGPEPAHRLDLALLAIGHPRPVDACRGDPAG